MTVNENNVINNVNETATAIKLDKKIDLASNVETLRLDVYYEKEASMLKEAKVKSVTVTENADMTLSGVPSFSDLEDGKLYFRLYKVTTNGDKTVETLLSETVVEKTTDAIPQIAEVTAKRDGTNNVVYEGTRYGESDIQTIYYCAVPSDASDGTLKWNPTSKTFTANGITNYTAVTYTIDVNGANSINKTLPGLNSGKAYNLFYVLENKKGTQSVPASATETMVDLKTNIPYVEVAKDKSITAESKVTSLKYDKSSKQFTWTAPTQGQQKGAKGYIVTIYNAQKNIVATEEINTATNYILDATKAKGLGLGAGEYYITLVTKGDVNDGTPTVDSEAVESENTVKIGQIAPITNVKYVIDAITGKPKLTWTENDKNCVGEELTFKMDQNNDDGLTTDQSMGVKTKNGSVTSFELGALSYFGGKDTVWEYQSGYSSSYIANYNALNRASSVEMVAKATTAIADDDETAFYLDSEPTTFNFYIPYRVTKVESTTDKSALLQLDLSGTTNYYEDKKSLVYGAELEDYKYKVRVYTSDGTYIKTVTTEAHLNDTNKNGKYDDGEIFDFTVDGLASNTEYQFRLVTTCGEFEAWSAPTTSTRTMPKIQGLKKVETDGECEDNSKTFYTDGSKLTVEENEYNNDTNKYLGTQFDDLVAFLDTLNNGDVVTIDGNNIELTLNSEDSKIEVLKADYVADKYITITGSKSEYALETLPNQLPKEVHIKSGQFDITKLKVNDKDGVITLGNGSAVKADVGQKLTIEAGATVTINGLKITTSKENVVKIGANDTIEVVANNNTLTFENVSAKVNGEDIPDTITIKFVSSDGNDAVQQGSITILNKDESAAKIVVTQENVTVEGGLTVNVEKGEVDVSDVNITASKSVTLSKDATITAMSEANVPEELIGTTVTIKNYATVDDLIAEFKDDASKGYSITPEVLTKINTWLATFGISEKGAKVTVGSENKITISYEGAETLTVRGLK